MRNYLLALLLLVSGCNFADCFDSDDITTTNIVDEIPTKPAKLDLQDNTTLWHPSKFNFIESDITFSIQSRGANLCDEKKISVVGDADVPIKLLDGDSVSFEIKDVFSKNIDDASCNGLDPNFYTAYPEICKNGVKDENGNLTQAPYKGTSYGAVFTQNIDSVNVIRNSFYAGNVDDFFRDAANVPLFSMENANVMKKIANGDFTVLSKIDADKRMDYVCDNLKKPEILAITKQMSFKSLAQYCKKICGAFDDESGSYANVKQNCFFSETSEKNTRYTDGSDAEQKYITYIPGLEVSTNGGAAIPNYHSRALSGIVGLRSNHPYVISRNQPVTSLAIKTRQGKYSVSVQRKCDASAEKSLYYYVGESAPDLKPGDAGTTNIPLKLNAADNQYTLSGNVNGTIYFAVKDNGDGHDNNTGHFQIQARIPNKIPDIFSYRVRYVRDIILKMFYGSNFGYDKSGKPLINPKDADGAVGRIYNAIIGSVLFDAVKIIITLYISIFGIIVLMGLSKTPHIDFLILALKISLILVVFSDKGWQFLNNHLFYWFIYGSSDLITAFSGDFSGGVDFGFIDASLGRFYRYQTWLQILSLLFAGPVGWLVMSIILFGVISFFSAIFQAIVTYIISMTLVALLLSISPIFISLIFFKKTKGIFDAWIKNLLQIAIQPVFIMATIAFLSQVTEGIMYGLFSFGACSGCIAEVEVSNLDPMCILSFMLPYGFSPVNVVGDHIKDTYNGFSFMGLPVAISNVIAFAITTHAISKFTDQASTMATSVFGAFGADISDPAKKFTESAKSMVGRDSASMQNKAQASHAKKTDDKAGKGSDEAKGDGGSKKDTGKKR